MIHKNLIHPDLLIAQKTAYEPNGLIIEKLEQEAESREYAACGFLSIIKS